MEFFMTVKSLPLDQLISIETSGRAGEFIQLARCWAAAKGSPTNAVHEAERRRVAPRVVEILKAATDPGTLGDATWGANLTPFDGLAAAFVESLRNVDVFDTMLPSMRRVPLTAAASVISLGASGASVDEGSWKRIDALEVGTSGPLTPRKAVAVVVTSNDLWRSIAADAQALIRRELQAAVAHVTDEEFLSVVSNGVVAAGSSSGSDVGSVLADLKALLGAVQTGQGSRLFLVMSSDNAKAVSVMGGDDGFAFEQMTPQGGSIQGVPVLVSDSIEPDQVMLIDANGIAASAGTVVLSSASHATLRLSDDPESDTALTSLWQRTSWGSRLSVGSAAHASATTPWPWSMASITRTRRPRNMAISKQSMAALAKAFAPVIGEFVEKQTAPLKQRIKELEARPSLRYCGVWKADVSYGEGAAVTFDGSTWIAKAIAPPGEKPGEHHSWQLAVKRGRDGKDGRDAR
jgi:Phage capsid family